MAAGNFFGGQFFGGGFFGTVDVAKTGTGGIDPQRRIVKPTGILHLPAKLKRGKLPEKIEERLEESLKEEAEISEKLAREFGEDTQRLHEEESAKAVLSASMAEVDREIGNLLRKKLRTEEDEILLLLLMVAAAA